MSDWNNFFASLRKYLDYFRAHIQVFPKLDGLGGVLQTISESELAGLLSWTNLATAIALKDSESRRQIIEDRNWNCVETATGLVACPIPLVLKGSLYKLLSTLAIDEIAAINIWNCLFCEGICMNQQDGKLTGIQQDLDERESQLKTYECAEGFLTMLKRLLSHKSRPTTQQIAPYLQYAIISILCQFSSRSYNDSKQMWRLVKLAIDSLYEPLKSFYATPATVREKTIEVQILAQLLSDSPLSRTLLQIIIEGSYRSHEESIFCQCRDDASCSAIRLFFTAISNHDALADAVRAVNSDIILVSIESILFSPIPHLQKAGTNYLNLLFQYISPTDHLIRHTFYVWLILKEATAQRPSLQSRIIQALLPQRAQLISAIASLSIFSPDDISISVHDFPLTNVETQSYDRIKGEVCRLMFEVFNDSMESNPDSPNLAYAMMNFDLNDIQSSSLEISNSHGFGFTILHNILEIVNRLALPDDPFSFKFSGLYEPALCLLLRMCQKRAASSVSMLRFLRSQYDLFYRLASSNIFCRMNIQLPKTRFGSRVAESTTLLSWKHVDEEIVYATMHKSMQAMILEFIALELSSLIRMGQIEQPQKYFKILLSTDISPRVNSLASDSLNDGEETRIALLWELLIASRVFVEPLGIPSFSKFDIQKVEELLSLCVRKNSFNIDQFDVLYLHLLLNSEINCIINAEIDVIREEAKFILNYCVKKNAQNLLEGACTHLLEGWLCLMNVLSVHVPLPFINIDVHQHLLVDALFLLRDYCGTVEMSQDLAASIAMCIARLIRAICSLFTITSKNIFVQEAILPILHLLLQCIVLPGYNKSVAFKLELYASCLRTMDLFNKFSQTIIPPSNVQQPMLTNPASSKNDDDLLNILLSKVGQRENMEPRMNKNVTSHDPAVLMVREERRINDLWIQLIEPLTHETVQTLTSDIVFAPLPLKMLATATFVDLLKEDSHFNGRMAKEFAITGSLQCVSDTSIRLRTSITANTVTDKNVEQIKNLAIALDSLVTMAKSFLRCQTVS